MSDQANQLFNAVYREDPEVTLKLLESANGAGGACAVRDLANAAKANSGFFAGYISYSLVVNEASNSETIMMYNKSGSGDITQPVAGITLSPPCEK